MRKNLYIINVIIVLLLLQTGTALASKDVYVVRQGDTLWDIAIKNGVTVDTLLLNNSLSSDLLQIGMKLNINSSTDTTPHVLEASLKNRVDFYTVRKGDNLSTIACNFNTTVEQLKSLNNLTSDFLNIGDKLRICNATSMVIPSRAGNIDLELNESNFDKTNNNTDIIDFAAKYLGIRYRYGGFSPSGFDCSGFVGYVFKNYGYNLPRTAASIFTVGKSVDKSELREGDLVFFKGPGSSCINHVGIYSGNNQFIHSSSGKAYSVTYSSLDSTYYHQYYAGAKRILSE